MTKIIKVLILAFIVSIFCYIFINENNNKKVTLETSYLTYNSGKNYNIKDGDLEVIDKNKNSSIAVSYVDFKGVRYVELRDISNALDGRLYWFDKIKVIVMELNKINYILRVNENIVTLDNENIDLNYPIKIIDSKSFVPENFLDKVIGFEYSWKVEKASSFNFEIDYKGISIGSSFKSVESVNGKPSREDESIYDFKWHIYNNNYLDYSQIGMKNGLVTAIFSNSDNWNFKNKVTMGENRADVNKKMGESLEYIKKNKVKYFFEKDNWDMYEIDNCYLILFFDKFNGNSLNSVLIISKEEEDKLLSYYGDNGEDLMNSMELEIFDITNAFRAKNGEDLLEYNKSVSKVARKHSKDMAENNFFNHLNLSGETPFDRLIKSGLYYSKAAENIASGQRNSVYAVEAWINSKEHRISLLGDYESLGIGVYQGGNYNIYYTQCFYTKY